jgi:hypothetical protein
MYKITDYSYNQAQKLNVNIKPSKKGNFKVDVHDIAGNYITSIGDKNYNDYPTYIQNYGKEYADERRKLYKKRHEKDRKVKNSRGFYADKILW